MLLPQPNSRSLFDFAVPAAALAILITMLPGRARAAAEHLSCSPTTLSYGSVTVGQDKTLVVTLTNKGSASIKISSIDSNSSKFEISKLTLPMTLTAGAKLDVSVTFAPTTAGWVGGDVTVASNASNGTVTVGVGGTGKAASRPQLSIAPTTLSFGNVGVGTNETLTLGLNSSAGNITIISASSSSSQFALSGVAFPLTITAGKETSVNVTFTPQNDGEKSATLTFISNAENSPTSEPLTGTGTAPYVTLSWVASNSEVIGYNVYRGTSETGTYTKINSSLDPDTSYTDKTIVDGKTYYYATTAVNSSGKESGYSNRAKVVVP
jgi:Abnormal spindle-like microcephaly-assoc'd, ASPM-SPD-2-Hydin